MWIGTFHGLCNRLLRAHHKLAGLPQAFQILDTQDQLSAIKRLCKQFNVDEERFPSSWPTSSPAARKTACARRRAERATRTRAKVEIYQLYEEQCQREGVVDFGELMLRSYELLRDNDPCASTTSGAFATSWSTSSRTPTSCSTLWLKQLAATMVGPLQPAA
jgi:DNA helicase-2/ATP-dependent DNA helicase PcrA